MVIFRNTYTNVSKVDRLLYLVDSNYFFAIGKNTTWDNSWGTDISDLNPPAPEVNLTAIPDIKLYKKPFYQTLATESQCGNVQFDSCGEVIGQTNLTLINLETTDRKTLDVISPSYLYFRILIEADDLTFAGIDNFRVASLFKDTTFNTEGQIRYLPNNLVTQGSLYWVSYFTPILNTDLLSKTSIFQILLKL